MRWKMKKNNIELNNQRGVTLLVLAIMVIVLIIIATITIYTGRYSIRRANLEELKTNMLLIQTKAKEYVENASFKLGVNPEEATDEMRTNAMNELTGEDKGTRVENINDSRIDNLITNGNITTQNIEEGEVYILITENLEKMGIKNVQSDEDSGYYVIVYDIENATAEIYNTVGYNDRYSLTQIENIEEVE